MSAALAQAPSQARSNGSLHVGNAAGFTADGRVSNTQARVDRKAQPHPASDSPKQCSNFFLAPATQREGCSLASGDVHAAITAREFHDRPERCVERFVHAPPQLRTSRPSGAGSPLDLATWGEGRMLDFRQPADDERRDLHRNRRYGVTGRAGLLRRRCRATWSRSACLVGTRQPIGRSTCCTGTFAPYHRRFHALWREMPMLIAMAGTTSSPRPKVPGPGLQQPDAGSVDRQLRLANSGSPATNRASRQGQVARRVLTVLLTRVASRLTLFGITPREMLRRSSHGRRAGPTNSLRNALSGSCRGIERDERKEHAFFASGVQGH